ncbi:hypothetical protein AAL_05133 [Moelleriella libera RCEF 2490]|uniref:Transcription initiation factor IIA small subunit n=1 Tax=Moelleriella libera RCEF 2490 TaxID=1081109 RepID=A0A168AP72_9HYPO|nr:hypothetical protein AAL_05133 [Moelleriella libera RCEF 2490]
MIRQRRGRQSTESAPAAAAAAMSQEPAAAAAAAAAPHPSPPPPSPSPTTGPLSQWLVFAMASGACAAFNGAFAKLTTTELTSRLASAIAQMLHLASYGNAVEVLVRGMFFALNLIFNGIMWTLFTKALAKGSSTTQVSIINTSTNFMLTALLGLWVFGEALPPMWWAGATLLVIGNVVVGRKDEQPQQGGDAAAAAPLLRTDDASNEGRPQGQAGDGRGSKRRDGNETEEDEDVPDLGDLNASVTR